MDIIEILKKVEAIRKLASVVPAETKNPPAAEQSAAEKPRKKQKKPLTQEQLKHIAERESKNLKAAQTNYEELETEIKAYFSQENRLEQPEDLELLLIHLKKILLAYECQTLTDGVSLDTPHYRALPEQLPYYNHEVYQKVLPICQLAYAIERNGDPEEHAFKLAMTFKNPNDAIEYLQTYEIYNPKAVYKVHDACGFDLPEVGCCDFRLWQDLANQPSQHKKPNMFSPAFRALLKQAEAIESVYKKPWESSSSRSAAAVKLHVKEYVSLTQQFKKLMLINIDHPTDKQKAELKEKKSQLSQEITQKLIQILEACPLAPSLSEFINGYDNEAQLAILEAFHEHYRLQSSGAHKILTDNGIQLGAIKRYYDLKPQNDDAAIPNLVIDGKLLGYPGYYLKKLDVTNDMERAMAASLGKFNKTHSCQYLGGQGSECTEHLITSPNGGAYVLFKGDPENPPDKDEVTGMTWAWRGHNEGICLDSIESHHENTGMVADFYRYLALELCTNDSIPGCPATYVNCGSQSGISSKTGLKNYPARKIFYKDYRGYNDSTSQLKLADPDMPYMFHGQVHSEQLKEIINNKTQVYLTKHLSNASPYKDNNALKKTIAFALYTQNENLLQLLRDLAGNRLEEINALIQINKEYLEQLSAGHIDFSAFEKGAYLNAMNANGQTALHITTLNADVEHTRALIKLGIDVNVQDKKGNTALLRTLEFVAYKKKNEKGKEIATMLMDAGADVDAKDKNEQTPLIIAVKNNDLPMVQNLVARGADIEIFDDDLKTAIFWAAEKGNEAIFDYLNQLHAKVNLSSYSSSESLFAKAVQSKNQNIINKLLDHKDIAFSTKNRPDAASIRYAMFDLGLLKRLLSYYPKNEHQELMRVAFTRFYIFGNQSVYVHNDLLSLLNGMEEEKRLNVQKFGDYTSFSIASVHSMLLLSILEDNPPEKLWELMKSADSHANSVFVYFVQHFPVMEYVYTRLSDGQKEQFWKLTNTAFITVLKIALTHGNPDNLKFLLENAPHDKLVQAVTDSIFDFNHQNITAVQMVIPYLSGEELFTLLSKENDEKRSALQALLHCFQGLDTTSEIDRVIALLSKKLKQEDFIKLLITRRAPSSERTALQMIVSLGSNSLLKLIDQLSPEALGKLFVEHDEGASVVNSLLLSNEPGNELIQAIFNKLLLSREKKLLFLLKCIKDDMLLLTTSPSLWKLIVQLFTELFPDEEEEQSRIFFTEVSGAPFFQTLASSCPNEFCSMFSRISPELQLKVVQHKQISGSTLLQRVHDQIVVKEVLESFQPAQRLSILVQENDAGVTVIEHLAHDNTLFTAALDTLSQDQTENLMSSQDLAARILAAAAMDKASFAKALTIIPSPIPPHVLQQALDKKMLLKSTMHEGELDEVLKIIPEEEQEDRIKWADKDHELIRSCIGNHKIQALEKILNGYSEPEIYTIYKNKLYDDVPLYLHIESNIARFKEGHVIEISEGIRDYEKIRELFLNRLTEEHRHELKFLPIDREGNTILHKTAPTPKQLREVVKEIPATELFNMMLVKNKEGKTALSEAYQNHRSLGVILEALPDEEKLKFLQTHVFSGEMTQADETSGSVVSYITSFPYQYKDETSFVSEYLNVYKSIHKYLNRQPSGTLFEDKLPGEMFHILFTSTTFDEVKTQLFDTAEKNPEHIMIKALMRHRGDLEQLRVQWGNSNGTKLT
ncbi:ankyrin repeat domain-containing protein [Legionella shakespearei]|uniref:Ankyrin repeat protein n=1 Tax=Legionella shakespearei DSM 23087 TaxID=1122169 RepID=A0A0W0YQC1_9GAMM|nr:ankyrin repeat domain-containing protein [Legionella shakespearei]KTD59051.1 Ankyrin repeat protein [Legionella shakespearei DSM 23087]